MCSCIRALMLRRSSVSADVHRQVIATIRASPSPECSIYSCSINPVNPTKCCVSGNGVFRYLSIEEDRCVLLFRITNFFCCRAFVAYVRVCCTYCCAITSALLSASSLMLLRIAMPFYVGLFFPFVLVAVVLS
jgi:hypothetical protein